MGIQHADRDPTLHTPKDGGCDQGGVQSNLAGYQEGQASQLPWPSVLELCCLPQTWEDPNVMNHEVGCVGDNDPLDVVEIGSNTLAMGSISQVKPLGVFSMIDDGELDWKMVAIQVDDELADQLNSVEDLERLCPGTISGIREWFRWYKTPDGKPINGFGHNEELLNADKALDVIEETHKFWQDLRAGKTDPGKLWVGN